MRVIVVGSGASGLLAAYRAATRGHDVTLVTKADLPEANTRYAQGGIAAVTPESARRGDTVDSHVANTLAAGAGLCDPEAVRVLCAEGPERVRDLLALGLDLDRVDGPGSPLALGREAAHTVDRILHSHGDATGLSLEIALLNAVRSVPVEVIEHAALRDLLTVPLRPLVEPHAPVVEPVETPGRRVVGVDLLHADGTTSALHADAVILATGGAGQLFAHTTNPAVTTGDGIAAALRAGAEVADLEFYQFHPTALAVPGTPLISEAVRGEGAVLRDAAGRRFMRDVHPDAELAPRDVVARGIAAAMAAQDGQPVVLDTTALGAERMAARFPGITATLAHHGYTWDQPIPVTPAAHYWMGGIRTDLSGRTSLPGLFAVGEAACTGVHGANRLASNSLLEALVFGWRAADALDAPEDTCGVLGAARPASEVRELPLPPRSAALARGAARGETVLDEAVLDGASLDRPTLRALLWANAGLFRDATGLRAALRVVGGGAPEAGATERFVSLSTIRGPEGTNGRQTPDPSSVAELEDRNLALLGFALVSAALARTESRGGHARADFLATDPAQATSTAWRLPESALVPTLAPTALTPGVRA